MEQNTPSDPRRRKGLPQRLLSGLLAATIAATSIMPTVGDFAYAAQVDPGSESSWNTVYGDGSLAGDTAPGVEGKNDRTAYTHVPAPQQSMTIGRVTSWNSTSARTNRNRSMTHTLGI